MDAPSDIHLQNKERDANRTRLMRIIDGLMAQREFLNSHLDEVNAAPQKYTEDEAANTKKKIEELNVEFEKYSKLSDETRVERDNKLNGRLNKEPLYYSDYLCLDLILNAQKLESEKSGSPAHHEMLFIIIHQAFELWFKQVLHELKAAIKLLDRDYIPDRDMSVVLHHFDRVIEIQSLLIKQFDVLDTMTPLDFMDFRDYLFPASGFQSWQFRLLENTLGLQSDRRVQYERKAYHTRLSEEHQKLVQMAESGATLFNVVEKWLERTPFLKEETENFDFLDHYKNAAEVMFEEDRKVIKNITLENSPERMKEIQKVEENRTNFLALFDEHAHDEQIKAGSRRLSYRATQAALLIFIYQDEPILHVPFRLLEALIHMDEHFAAWRSKHAMMVHRMIGTKVGTGGSSGYWYLRSTIERGRVFSDIGNLSTYLIRRSDVPPLPNFIRKKLGFALEGDSK